MTRAARPSAAADTDRAISDLVREGVVAAVDLDQGTAVVRIGDIETPPCQWAQSVGDTTIWIPLTVGQPVTVICPEGDIERAYISGSLPSTAMPPLNLGNKVALQFKDGALIAYDPSANLLQLDLPGRATLIAPSGVAIEADLAITGHVSVTGDISSTGTVSAETDVVGAGKSLKGHKHTGVQTGSGISGAPQ
ncbi:MULTISPECIES: phage baseplate assembly protein V [unclassified Brevundimonas]|uniref:phage baseplate assembly protein V n=1 Tax=unclassified Brevundimonas TaxID=2622653 RepID=UPI0025B80609|nr:MULTISPECIES: phage baseplate assembly protein V [unclassified Brevundimonas]